MTRLQKTLDALPTPEDEIAHPCFSLQSQVAALIVETSTDRRWVLPWQYFLHAEHSFVAEREVLLLVFASHRVTVRGNNLIFLIEALANFRLETIRTAPTGYEAGFENDPFVAEIIVEATASAEVSEKTRVSS